MSTNFQRAYLRVFNKLFWFIVLLGVISEVMMIWAVFSGGDKPLILPYMLFIMLVNPLLLVNQLRIMHVERKIDQMSEDL
jgi:hypothetical protein